jgi:hypothetical protein
MERYAKRIVVYLTAVRNPAFSLSLAERAYRRAPPFALGLR